jgi:hypothetical protein
MRNDDWSSSVAREVDVVYRRAPGMRDDRPKYPGLIGHLGDHTAKVWFIGWYPSLKAIQRASTLGTVLDPELQWTVTRGDQIFRATLVEFGFKSGEPMGRGGWMCYVTNLVKRPIDVGLWNRASVSEHSAEYVRWIPVLGWEIENGKPEVIVAMGQEVARQLVAVGPHAAIARRATVMHYATFNYDDCPPDRLVEYREQFRRVARMR